jgi:hypothetical protein
MIAYACPEPHTVCLHAAHGRLSDGGRRGPLGRAPVDDVAARRLAAGVIGSFPFVLFFQGLSLPILTAITIVTFIFDIWSGPANGWKLIIAEFVLALQLVIFLAGSVVGGVTGYGIGVRMAAGAPIRLALASWLEHRARNEYRGPNDGPVILRRADVRVWPEYEVLQCPLTSR